MLGVKSNLLLYGIRPALRSHRATELEYPHLKAIIHRHYAEEYGHIDSLWSQIGGATESAKHDYLLLIAQKLQDSVGSTDKQLWSRRYTEVSVSIYGKPENNTVGDLAQSEFGFFERSYVKEPVVFKFLIPLLERYAGLATNASPQTQSLELSYTNMLKALNDYVQERYGDVLGLFDGWHRTMMPLEQVSKRFEAALDMLALSDVEWRNWKVVLTDNSGLMVNPNRREIEIGGSLLALPTARIKGLFAHEVLTHAQRSVNGGRYSEQLAVGLDGCVSAEEGLGILMETAVNGAVPHRIRDRYIDTALALGGYGGRAVTRPELYNLAYARARARRLIAGEDVDPELLRKITWTHVNRIYRGTLGNDFIGVFTKDISYYKGFYAMANYVLHRTDWGASIAEVLEYLMSGKFDPTDPYHAREIKGHLS